MWMVQTICILYINSIYQNIYYFRVATRQQGSNLFKYYFSSVMTTIGYDET